MLVPAVLVLLSLPFSFRDVQQPASLRQADSLRKEGKLSEARDAFEQVLAAEPANAAAQQGEVEVSERMALDARGAGKMDEALKDLLRAQKFAPENPRLLYDLGILEDEMRCSSMPTRRSRTSSRLFPTIPRLSTQWDA